MLTRTRYSILAGWLAGPNGFVKLRMNAACKICLQVQQTVDNGFRLNEWNGKKYVNTLVLVMYCVVMLVV